MSTALPLKPGTMLIDPSSIRDLEVVGKGSARHAGEGRSSTLVAALNKTRTPMGYRLLKVSHCQCIDRQSRAAILFSNTSFSRNRQICCSL